MARGSFGVSVPVDGGEHRIEAAAPGRKPFSAVVLVKRELDSVRGAIPALEDAPPEPPPAPPVQPAPVAPAPAPVPQAPPASTSGSTLRTAGLITAGVGVVALGVGSYLALDAKSSYSSAKDQCDGNDCPKGPYDDIQDARSQGTVATIVFAVGGAALATGAVLWIAAPSGAKEGAPAVGWVRVERVGLGPGGVALRGSF